MILCFVHGMWDRIHVILFVVDIIYFIYCSLLVICFSSTIMLYLLIYMWCHMSITDPVYNGNLAAIISRHLYCHWNYPVYSEHLSVVTTCFWPSLVAIYMLDGPIGSICIVKVQYGSCASTGRTLHPHCIALIKVFRTGPEFRILDWKMAF